MRADGWEERLAAEIAAARTRRWRWGRHDCVTFAHACARAALGGATPWDGWALDGRGAVAWASESVARAILDEGGGLLTIVDGGAPRLASPLMAQRGDVAALPGQRGEPCLGVVEAAHVWIAARRGLDRAPLEAALAAWPVR